MLRQMPRFLFAAAAAVLVATSALAQQQPAPPANPECAAGMQSSPTSPKSGEAPLGDKLAQSKGVICPPDVDPAMKIPPPETGAKMPVIPPPGTPGGERKLDPK